MPAEYMQSGNVSAKTDTYAFGVVLLELLTGKPPMNRATRELLSDTLAPELEHPEQQFGSCLDGKVKWEESNVQAGCKLAAIAAGCLKRAPHRSVVADVVDSVDKLAGRRSSRVSAPQRPQSPSLKCANCGAALEADGLFCSTCGAPRPGAARSPTARPGTQQSGRSMSAGAAFVTQHIVMKDHRQDMYG